VRPRRLSTWVAVVVAIGLCAMIARAVLAGETELARSTAALDARDPREAVVRARRAAGWHVPAAPHVRAAYQRLRALARGAEEHRDDGLALFAWRSMRAAAVETRGLFVSNGGAIAEADREIARLVAKAPRGEAPDPAAAARVAAEELARLRLQRSLHPAWSLALVAGFAACAAAFVVSARRASDPGGRLVWARARAPLCAGAFGLALWLLALWRA
jgi:hypothetical protein